MVGSPAASGASALFQGETMTDVQETAEVYTALRSQALSLTSSDLGLDAPVLAVVMDTRYPEAVATLVGVADGSTSLYFSNGGGIIGGGQHPQVAEATQRLLGVAASLAGAMSAGRSSELPDDGVTQLTVVTPNGRVSARAAEDELGAGQHELSQLFYAAHDVITQLRLVEGD
jgi:hypothetical protein